MPLPLLPIASGFFASISITSLKYLIPFVALSLIKFLGVTLITYSAVDLATNEITNFLTSSMSNLGSDVLNLLRMGGIIDAFDITMAGWAAQLQLRQIMGSFSRISLNPTNT
jgi:hypothetical protein